MMSATNNTKRGRKPVIMTVQQLDSYIAAFESLLGKKHGAGATGYYTPTPELRDKRLVVFSVSKFQDNSAVLSPEQRVSSVMKRMSSQADSSVKTRHVLPKNVYHDTSHVLHLLLPMTKSGRDTMDKAIYNAVIEQGAMCMSTYFLRQFAKVNKGKMTACDLHAMTKNVSDRIGYDLPVTHYAHKWQLADRTNDLLGLIKDEKKRATAARVIASNMFLAKDEITLRCEGTVLKVPEPKFKVSGAGQFVPA